MGLCDCAKDILKIHLDSETADIDTESLGKYQYNVKFPVKRNDYKKFVLYIDNFQIQTKGLGSLSYIVSSNMIEYNSYNSKTKGANTVLVSLLADATATDRTNDFTLSYSNSTAPIHIQNIPELLQINITDIDGGVISFANANNMWAMDLRIEAFY